MLTREDRRAIDGLFQRLDAVEREAREPRDPEAEALIHRRIAEQPSAPYYMAQTVIVQQRALEAAEQRIAELEQTTRSPWDRRDRVADDRNDGRYDRGYGNGFGGGFLAGAMQTALGVTGGMLLGSMIGGLFGAGSAHAAEAPASQDSSGSDGNDNDAGGDTGGSDAGDFGDGGGFDGGGMDFGGDF
jgi:hypothetical protein